MSRLFIIAHDDAFADLYRKSADAYNSCPVESRNAGFDLFCDEPSAKSWGRTKLVGQGCSAIAVNIATGLPMAYWLVPRSSISRGEWRLANSMGLIDATYRGTLMAALDPADGDSTHPFSGHTHRYVQVATPSLEPWTDVVVVRDVPTSFKDTERGTGGFGSTGR